MLIQNDFQEFLVVLLDSFHNSLKYIYEKYFLKDTIEFNDQKKETITYEKILHNENGLKFCLRLCWKIVMHCRLPHPF